MRKNILKKLLSVLTLMVITTSGLTGCSQNNEEKSEGKNNVSGNYVTENSTDENSTDENSIAENSTPENNAAGNIINQETANDKDDLESDFLKSDDKTENISLLTTELEVRFGYNGDSFIMKLEENETAAQIAEYVGTSNWNLPIYHYDDYENYEVMQYYDIPNRYKIPSNPQTITSEKAGEIYYSDPNRIILFYQDAEVTGEYTKIGEIEEIENLQDAVETNPVIEGWGNKIVSINSLE